MRSLPFKRTWSLRQLSDCQANDAVRGVRPSPSDEVHTWSVATLESGLALPFLQSVDKPQKAWRERQPGTEEGMREELALVDLREENRAPGSVTSR